MTYSIYCHAVCQVLHSFPTRRSSDLQQPFLLYLPMMLTHGQSYSTAVVPTPLDRSTDRSEQEMFAGMLRRSEEHTSELQSQSNIVCRLLIDKEKEQVYRARFDSRQNI